MKLTTQNDSATIGSTEYSLPADSTTLAAQTDDCELEVWVELANMAAGDQYRFRLYEKINGGTARVAWEAYRTGAQSGPLVIPRRLVAEGWDVTVKKEAGTDRSFAWSLRKLVEGETVAAVTLAAGAVTSTAIAASAVSELQAGLATEANATSNTTLVLGQIAVADTATVTALMAAEHETDRTFIGLLRRLEALLTGKATGLIGSLATFYRADGTTKAIEATQDTDLGTREAASTVGGD